jgi:hypothetical protein
MYLYYLDPVTAHEYFKLKETDPRFSMLLTEISKQAADLLLLYLKHALLFT